MKLKVLMQQAQDQALILWKAKEIDKHGKMVWWALLVPTCVPGILTHQWSQADLGLPKLHLSQRAFPKATQDSFVFA